MAEKSKIVRLRHKIGGNTIELPRAEWENDKKYGEAERAEWEEVPSEEEEQAKIFAQSEKDSKRYEAAIQKEPEEVQEAAARSEVAPPPQAEKTPEPK